MDDELLKNIHELLRLGHGDLGRLEHIKAALEKDKPLFNSDLKYVKNLIAKYLSHDESTKNVSSENYSDILDKPLKTGVGSSSTNTRKTAAGIVVVMLFIGLVSLFATFDETYYDQEYYDETYYDQEYYDETYYDQEYYDETYYDQEYYDQEYYDETYYDQESFDYGSIIEGESQQENDILREKNEQLERTLVEQQALTNPILTGLLNGDVKYYIKPLPNYSTYDIELFDEYLNGRPEAGVKLTRVSDESQADFSIWWVKDYGPETLGVAYTKRTATIGLGSTNCAGDWQHFDNYTITKIAWHEIGHVLGYGHSDDPANIMYPTIPTRYTHDQDIENKVIPDGWYTVFTFCNGGKQYYSFETDKTKYGGFKFFVIPPETNPKQFVSEGIGLSYECNKSDTGYFQVSGTCDVADGSKIIIYNTNDKPIKVNGYIQNKEPHPKIDLGWDDDAYEYKPEDLEYIRNLAN